MLTSPKLRNKNMKESAGIFRTCAMCASFHIQRIVLLTVRRDGARFSRMAHGDLTCAPFVLKLYMEIYMEICMEGYAI